MTEVITIQKNIASSPRKLRLVADLVRKMRPERALLSLEFTNKAAAAPLAKAIKTVLANAKAKNLEPEKLIFKSLEVNEGVKMRRFRPQARGRMSPYKKRTSQIKIVLSDEKGVLRS